MALIKVNWNLGGSTKRRKDWQTEVGTLQNEIQDCRFPKFWSFIGGVPVGKKTPDTSNFKMPP